MQFAREFKLWAGSILRGKPAPQPQSPWYNNDHIFFPFTVLTYGSSAFILGNMIYGYVSVALWITN